LLRAGAAAPVERLGVLGACAGATAPVERLGVLGARAGATAPVERLGVLGARAGAAAPVERLGVLGACAGATAPVERFGVLGARAGAAVPVERFAGAEGVSTRGCAGCRTIGGLTCILPPLAGAAGLAVCGIDSVRLGAEGAAAGVLAGALLSVDRVGVPNRRHPLEGACSASCAGAALVPMLFSTRLGAAAGAGLVTRPSVVEPAPCGSPNRRQPPLLAAGVCSRPAPAAGALPCTRLGVGFAVRAGVDPSAARVAGAAWAGVPALVRLTTRSMARLCSSNGTVSWPVAARRV
jgi:hypothetical protein